MAFWKIERAVDGMTAVIVADSADEAAHKFEQDYGADLYVEESTAVKIASSSAGLRVRRLQPGTRGRFA